MKHFNKIYYLFLILAIAFVACSKEDTTGALNYQNSRIVDFEVYVGSSTKRAIKIETDSIDSLKYFNPTFENYIKSSILFNGNYMEVSHSTIKTERNTYQFKADSLFINDKYFGTGSQNSITIRQQYIGYILSGSKIKLLQGDLTKDTSVDKIVKNTPFGTLENMKAGDTLMWCVRESLFE